eukprot:m.91511 g.91511  ORF g.91511 m.91511 type:complete len:188 (-) comp8873_c4_seq1:56-619(-)
MDEVKEILKTTNLENVGVVPGIIYTKLDWSKGANSIKELGNAMIDAIISGADAFLLMDVVVALNNTDLLKFLVVKWGIVFEKSGKASEKQKAALSLFRLFLHGNLCAVTFFTKTIAVLSKSEDVENVNASLGILNEMLKEQAVTKEEIETYVIPILEGMNMEATGVTDEVKAFHKNMLEMLLKSVKA